MKIKKNVSLIILLMIILLIPTFVNARNAWDEKMEIGLETFKDWMEAFKSEETPIEKRIVDYQISQYGGGANNNVEDKLEMTIYFKVTPVDEENTYWKKEYANICFLKMSKVDGEFKIDYISDKPENYDKFLEEFEEYKKNNVSPIEIEQVQGAVDPKDAEPAPIKQISNVVMIVCFSILVIVVICIFIKIKKNKK